MKNKTIHQIASLIMALVMILGNPSHTQAATPLPETTGPSIYWGAMVNGKVPSSTNLLGVFNTFETRSGKKMSIIHWGQPWKMSDGSWGEFQTIYFNNARSHGYIPMINWASRLPGAKARHRVAQSSTATVLGIMSEPGVMCMTFSPLSVRPM